MRLKIYKHYMVARAFYPFCCVAYFFALSIALDFDDLQSKYLSKHSLLSIRNQLEENSYKVKFHLILL